MLWLQHVGKHFPLPLFTSYAICTLLRTNAVCILVYIPSLVGGALILAAVQQKECPRDV